MVEKFGFLGDARFGSADADAKIRFWQKDLREEKG